MLIDWDEFEEEEYDSADENQINLTQNQDKTPSRIEPKPIKQLSTGISLPTNLQKISSPK